MAIFKVVWADGRATDIEAESEGEAMQKALVGNRAPEKKNLDARQCAGGLTIPGVAGGDLSFQGNYTSQMRAGDLMAKWSKKF